MENEKEDPTEPNTTAEPQGVTLPPLPDDPEDNEVAGIPDGVFQYNHVACGSVAFYLLQQPAPMQHIPSMDKFMSDGAPYPADKDGTVTCQFCGAGMKHLSARHVTPVKI